MRIAAYKKHIYLANNKIK